MNGRSIKLGLVKCPYKSRTCRKLNIIRGCSLCEKCFEEENKGGE